MRNDAEVFPASLYEAALGGRCVEELKAAMPGQWADHGVMRDRFLINGGALAYWLWHHLQVNIFAIPDDAIRVDQIGEEVTVNGTSYQIPHWCYLSTGLEVGDPRPSRWTGIPSPVSTTSPASAMNTGQPRQC